MSYLFPTYQRLPLEIVSGNESTVYDATGKAYLDLTSGIGVMNVGYQHPKVVEALSVQAQQLWHLPNLYQNSLQEELAELLSYQQKYVSFFCNSGTEANEAAIKLARKVTGRSKIISFQQSFHGRTYGALSATGQPNMHQGFGPIVPDFTYLSYNDQAVLDAINNETAAVILELIQGEGGINVAEKAWVQQLATCCQKTGSLLIIDEVQTGIGRTGTFYAFESYQIEPDIYTLAKGLGNGFPVGAMLGKKEYAKYFQAGSHGSTFGGNKLAMAIGKIVVELVKELVSLNEVNKKGQAAVAELRKNLQNNPYIADIRGQGLMIGLEFTSKTAFIQAKQTLLEEGLLVLSAGQTVMRLLPSLTISTDELARGIEKISQVVSRLSTQQEGTR